MFSSDLTTSFRNQIDTAKTIWICVHVDPDGDCLWAWLGLWAYLEQYWKSVRYFVPSKISCIFSFLPEISQFQEHIWSYNPDIRISVDTATRSRSNLSQIITDKPILHIDHHLTDAPRWTLNLINDQCNSTCEIITSLIQQHKPENITPRIATFLLMWISTDTGHFQRWNNLAETFERTSFLLNQWADLSLIVNKLYRSNDYNGTKFVWKLMQRIVHDDRLIRVSLSQTELIEHNLDDAKTEQLLFIMTWIKHDGVFMLFKWFPDAENPYLKCSFRTKHPTLDVSIFAKQFWWGWHRAAAACRVFSDNLEQTQQAMIEWVKLESRI